MLHVLEAVLYGTRPVVMGVVLSSGIWLRVWAIQGCDCGLVTAESQLTVPSVP
jgi:hypothetical protein